MFIFVYGSGSDWVRNALASGHARLTVDREEICRVHADAPNGPPLLDAAWGS